MLKYCNEHVCLSVCASFCLSASTSPEPIARSLPIFVHVAHGRGSVLLQRNDEIPREMGNFGQRRIHGGKGRGGGSPHQTAAGQKIETPGRSKVGFMSPGMYQNLHFRAQKSTNLPGRAPQTPNGEGDTCTLPTPIGAWILSSIALT